MTVEENNMTTSFIGDEKFLQSSTNQEASQDHLSMPISKAIPLATMTPYGVPKMTTDTGQWLKGGVQSLINFLGTDIDFALLTTRHVGEWQKHEIDRDLSPVTINNYLRAIKTLYKNLHESGHTDCNPAIPIAFLPEPLPEPRSIERRDYLTLRSVAKNHRDKAIIATLWATGCRISGIMSMDTDKTKMESWVEDNQQCYALKVVEKFGKPRWAYVKGEEAEFLHTWIKYRANISDSALFVTLKSNPSRLSRPGLEHVLRRIRLGANVPDSRPTNAHAFRHAFAIRKLDEGYDLAVVSQWLGHASPEFTAKVYAFRRESELRRKYFSDPTIKN